MIDIPDVADELREEFKVLVAAERDHQLALGYSAEHDDLHDEFELSRAALAYMTLVLVQNAGDSDVEPPEEGSTVPLSWPFDPEKYRPRPTRIENLIVVGALVQAEIEREERSGTPGPARQGTDVMMDVAISVYVFTMFPERMLATMQNLALSVLAGEAPKKDPW